MERHEWIKKNRPEVTIHMCLGGDVQETPQLDSSFLTVSFGGSQESHSSRDRRSASSLLSNSDRLDSRAAAVRSPLWR